MGGGTWSQLTTTMTQEAQCGSNPRRRPELTVGSTTFELVVAFRYVNLAAFTRGVQEIWHVFQIGPGPCRGDGFGAINYSVP